jgi:hypothetical protein
LPHRTDARERRRHRRLIRRTVRFLRRREHGGGQAPSFGGVAETFDARNRGPRVYPERTIRGHVDSVQPGSGTAFSLLPAQNATGNFVKIVQCVPVKLIMHNLPKDVALGPGMSVVPTVRSLKNGFVVTVSTRALNGGRGASVAACAAVAWGGARSHCSCRAPIGQLQRLCRALPTARLGS